MELQDRADKEGPDDSYQHDVPGIDHLVVPIEAKLRWRLTVAR